MSRRCVSLAGTAVVLATAFSWLAALGTQPAGFDRLPPDQRPVFQRRFETELWPLLTRNGKDGCVGCHSKKLVSALRLSGDAGKDFEFLLREGFFLVNDKGSLLGRITAKDKGQRMPPDDRPAWNEAEIRLLREFVVDLDKKQKR